MSARDQRQTPNLDTVTTINADGSHLVLHPADVKGRFTLARRIFGFVLIAVYVLLPWIPINGHPAVFFDVLHGRFHVFGFTLITQDLWVLFFGISGMGFTLFYLTSLLGRLWCGWACPYTVFLEHVFRRVERWIDGDGTKRRQLDKAPMTAGKFVRRALKHGIYICLAAIIAHVFLSYFVSLERLYGYMQMSPAENTKAFGVVAFLTAVLYFCFGWFREQFCIVLCPYGRIQSALTDDDTMVIGYDEGRGEPRGKKRVKDGASGGDCIDCLRCVQVCPTGIDIRNGLQMECIGCAACVDACDTVMTKIKRPTGLVRYDSLNGLEGRKRRIIRPRVIGYTLMLVIGAFVMAFGLSSLKPARIEATRMAGTQFYETDDVIRNQFVIAVTNKRNDPMMYLLTADELPAGASLVGGDHEFSVDGLGRSEFTIVVTQEKEGYNGRFNFDLALVNPQEDLKLTKSLTFMGPDTTGMSDEEFKRQRDEFEKSLEEKRRSEGGAS